MCLNVLKGTHQVLCWGNCKRARTPRNTVRALTLAEEFWPTSRPRRLQSCACSDCRRRFRVWHGVSCLAQSARARPASAPTGALSTATRRSLAFFCASFLPIRYAVCIRQDPKDGSGFDPESFPMWFPSPLKYPLSATKRGRGRCQIIKLI